MCLNSFAMAMSPLVMTVAYEGEGIVGYLYQLYAWDMHDMDLDASAMDERRLTM